MTTAFVLGNGVSRQGVDLTSLQIHGKIYACNGIYREFVPDVLVATDRPISTAIQESGYALKNTFYTRRPIDGLGANKVPNPYFGYSSGPIATALAAEHGHRKIYMLGFDMGAVNNQFNNIYAGTEFYKRPDAPPTYTGNWVKQLIRITGDFPLSEFVRVHGLTTANIAEFTAVSNLKSISLQEFLQMYNPDTDL
jgi:hypothetical protein